VGVAAAFADGEEHRVAEGDGEGIREGGAEVGRGTGKRPSAGSEVKLLWGKAFGARGRECTGLFTNASARLLTQPKMPCG